MNLRTSISIVILLTLGATISAPVAAHSRHHSTGYWADESSHPTLHYHDHRRRVRTPVARQHCWEVPIHGAHHSDAELGGVLAGAVIGGLVGREFGKGRGRELATVSGALIGAELGRRPWRLTPNGITPTIPSCVVAPYTRVVAPTGLTGPTARRTTLVTISTMIEAAHRDRCISTSFAAPECPVREASWRA